MKKDRVIIPVISHNYTVGKADVFDLAYSPPIQAIETDPLTAAIYNYVQKFLEPYHTPEAAVIIKTIENIIEHHQYNQYNTKLERLINTNEED